jgi:hypothetical protein
MKHAPLHVLAGRALRSALAHWPLYAACAVIIFAIEAIVAYASHNQIAGLIVDNVLLPVFVTIIYAHTLRDLDLSLSQRDVWLRVLERAWAVIVIDLVVSLAAEQAIGAAAAADVLDELLAMVMLLLTATLIFADVHAVAEPKADPWWMLIPRSFAGSISAVLLLGALSRAMLLVLLSIVVILLGIVAQTELAARHVAHADFWGAVPLNLLLIAPINALTAFVYLDAIGYAPGHTPEP